MPLYFYVVRNQKVRFPVRAVVALPQGITKVRFRTVIGIVPQTADARPACSYLGGSGEWNQRVNYVIGLFWKSDGTLITQTTITNDETEVPVPPNTAYVEWRIPPNAVYTTDVVGIFPRVASDSLSVNIMRFVDQAGNIADVNINLVYICSGWDRPVSVTSSELPLNVDIPFCHDCGGDFSRRSALRGIYAMIKNSQNAKLQAVLLDANKVVLASCPEQAVGDISSDTEIWLCPDNDPDLVTYLKVNYPNTRYIRVKIDKSNPAGPLPAAIFTIYFSVDKGSIP